MNIGNPSELIQWCLTRAKLPHKTGPAHHWWADCRILEFRNTRGDSRRQGSTSSGTACDLRGHTRRRHELTFALILVFTVQVRPPAVRGVRPPLLEVVVPIDSFTSPKTAPDYHRRRDMRIDSDHEFVAVVGTELLFQCQRKHRRCVHSIGQTVGHRSVHALCGQQRLPLVHQWPGVQKPGHRHQSGRIVVTIEWPHLADTAATEQHSDTQPRVGHGLRPPLLPPLLKELVSLPLGTKPLGRFLPKFPLGIFAIIRFEFN